MEHTQVVVNGAVLWEGDLASVLRIDKSNLEAEACRFGDNRATFAILLSKAERAVAIAEADQDQMKGSVHVEMKAKLTPDGKPITDTLAEQMRRGDPRCHAAALRVADAVAARVLCYQMCNALQERYGLLRALIEGEARSQPETSPEAETLDRAKYHSKLEEAQANRAARKEEAPAQENGKKKPAPRPAAATS